MRLIKPEEIPRKRQVSPEPFVPPPRAPSPIPEVEEILFPKEVNPDVLQNILRYPSLFTIQSKLPNAPELKFVVIFIDLKNNVLTLKGILPEEPVSPISNELWLKIICLGKQEQTSPGIRILCRVENKNPLTLVTSVKNVAAWSQLVQQCE